ncbi:MAG: hypothetical protein HZR80_19660 [Candidatus Heimdallarchaeota archaeon]
MLLFNILDTAFYLDTIYFDIVTPGLGLLPLFFLNRGSMVVFAIFIMTMVALIYVLRKSSFYAETAKREQLFTYIVLVVFLLWLDGLINYLILPMVGSESSLAIYFPYISLQIIVCLLIAGNYLEFAVKIRNVTVRVEENKLAQLPKSR